MVGTIFVSKLTQFVINKIISYRQALFFKPIAKNTWEIPENTEKVLNAIPAHYCPLHGVMRLQLNPIFAVIVAWYPHLFASLSLVDKLIAVLTIKQKLFQPSHNCVFPAIAERSELFWRAIRALTYNLLINPSTTLSPMHFTKIWVVTPSLSFFNHQWIVARLRGSSGYMGWSSESAVDAE